MAPERFRGDYESQQVDKQDVYASVHLTINHEINEVNRVYGL